MSSRSPRPCLWRQVGPKNRRCNTCGAPVPETRLDKRYCSWKHDPDLLDPGELAELSDQHPQEAS